MTFSDPDTWRAAMIRRGRKSYPKCRQCGDRMTPEVEYQSHRPMWWCPTKSEHVRYVPTLIVTTREGNQ